MSDRAVYPDAVTPPSLHALLRCLREDPALVGSLARRQLNVAVPEPARAPIVAAAAHGGRGPLVVAVPTEIEAERLVGDLAPFLGVEAVDLFPAWETLPFERVSPSVDTMGLRMRTMWRLGRGTAASERPAVVVASARALVQRLGPHVEDVEPIVVERGSRLDPQELVEALVAAGYRREYQVEHRGEVAVRGSIVDVYPSTADEPVRVDLWGDEVDRLSTFGVDDQRANRPIERVEIFPCRELLPTAEVTSRARDLVSERPWGAEQWERLANGETFDGMESWVPWLTGDADHVLFDLLGDDALIVLVEPRRLRDRAREIIAEEADLAATLAGTWGVGADEDFPRLHLDFDRLLARSPAAVWTMGAVADGPGVDLVTAAAWYSPAGDPTRLIRQLGDLTATGYRVVVAADNEASAERFERQLREFGVGYRRRELDANVLAHPGGSIVVAPLSRGFILTGTRIAVLAEPDLTGRRRSRRPPRRQGRRAQAFFDDLKVGGFVVHHHHGVARFGGMVRRTVAGVERDYLLLEYRGEDRLYVPSDQIDSVRHYTGGDTPSLSRMGGADFAKTKARVAAEVAKVAQELVVLYQRRINTVGTAFGPDTPWQHEMEDLFPFEETVDQLRAISDVKADMERPRPMDRLVIGDVGFGKTEVAIRAAFKAVQNGTQVAILVPTTLLAQQHFATFAERFAGYPVRVEVLSRFLTAAQARKVVEGLRSGEVDVVIGTHRLLGADVEFKCLGLLVVDEEQRFGVGHKEAIKHIKTGVDVLTLTATPIPRTMEMSLTGIRDLSLLQTPPAERQPILTYVGEYDERAVAEAIRRELLREGQVFFVHNRVADIDAKAEELRDLVPEARIAIAHGQMDEHLLEQVVYDFWEGRYDVLVCTTIIESGIDMPTVNTLVVERADLLGLGQLHQLRGRVGRAGMRAYAYLFFPRDRELTEEAYERLRTIGEATELGSGFRIAMRDLEIRGAGNLLGTGQSGHIAAVGYDLYCTMVNEAIDELNGTERAAPAEIVVELPVDANLPSGYIGREDLRLDAYRRLAEVRTQAEVADVEAEWTDRFGPVPEEAAALLDVARVRAECVRTGVTEVSVVRSTGFGGPPLVARLSPLDLPQSKQMRLERLYRKALYKPELHQLHLPVKAGRAMIPTILGALADLVDDAVVDPAVT
ncbi:MAG: transcription-repair coupling factor [Microthrixaceae bacterium]